MHTSRSDRASGRRDTVSEVSKVIKTSYTVTHALVTALVAAAASLAYDADWVFWLVAGAGFLHHTITVWPSFWKGDGRGE